MQVCTIKAAVNMRWVKKCRSYTYRKIWHFRWWS